MKDIKTLNPDLFDRNGLSILNLLISTFREKLLKKKLEEINKGSKVKFSKSHFVKENKTFFNLSFSHRYHPSIHSTEFKHYDEGLSTLLDSKNKYDVITCDLPINNRRFNPILDNYLGKDYNDKFNESHSIIYSALDKLKDDGILFAILEPSFMNSTPVKKVIEKYKKKGFFINGIIQTPIEYSKTCHIGVRLLLVVFSKRKTNNLFICDLKYDGDGFASNYNHVRIITDNFFDIDNESKIKNKSEILTGSWIDPKMFTTFHQFKERVDIEIAEGILSKDFKKIKLTDIAIINNGSSSKKSKFKENENAIYLSKYSSKTYYNLKELQSLKNYKESSYVQIILNEKKYKNHLSIYFKSKHISKVLSSFRSGMTIPYMSFKRFKEDMKVHVPIKEEVLERNNKNFEKYIKYKKIITEIEHKISDFSSNLNEVDSLMKKLGGSLNLTESEKILEKIKQGESKTLEFKSSFSKNQYTNKQDPELIKASLKNVVAFANTNGGTLLIGVDDDGNILGIENDFYKNDDKYKLDFKNRLKDKIGSKIFGLIDYNILEVNSKLIFVVDIKKSDKAVFYEKKDFYVRNNPSCDKLLGNDMIEYIESRFK